MSFDEQVLPSLMVRLCHRSLHVEAALCLMSNSICQQQCAMVKISWKTGFWEAEKSLFWGQFDLLLIHNAPVMYPTKGSIPPLGFSEASLLTLNVETKSKQSTCQDKYALKQFKIFSLSDAQKQHGWQLVSSCNDLISHEIMSSFRS